MSEQDLALVRMARQVESLTAELWHEIERIKDELDELKAIEQGASLYAQGAESLGSNVDLTDNNEQDVITFSDIDVPRGGILELFGLCDCTALTWSATTSVSLRLKASTSPSSGVGNRTIYPNYKTDLGRRGWAIGGFLGQYASGASGLSLTLSGQLWDYTKMTMRFYGTWTVLGYKIWL